MPRGLGMAGSVLVGPGRVITSDRVSGFVPRKDVVSLMG